ncbi:MAG: hypothetical protein ACYDAO_08130 [Thermoplasmataceae archaeon]|jgi:metal-responsive CopG/Arc/MetJ family transcriptional regulator
MKTEVIAIRIDHDISELINKLIKYKLSKNKTDAIRTIMQNGVQDARRMLEKKEKSEQIIKKWRENGFPALPDNLSEVSIRERE